MINDQLGNPSSMRWLKAIDHIDFRGSEIIPSAIELDF
jgi:hypothetical protein